MKGKGSLLFMLLSIFILAPALVGCKDKSSTPQGQGSASQTERLVNQPRRLEVDGGFFMLDSTRIRIVSTEFNYAFTPRDYWDDRMKLIKLSGFNTIFVRVPWVLHEPKEGTFDFSGERDLKELCRLARENNLLVWLNVGPYVGGNMDMGGMPWWLLKDDNIALRSTQTAFMSRVERYFSRLGKELSSCQLQSGGAIALIQIEEPDITGRNHKRYLAALRDKLKEAGFDSTLFTVASTADEMHNVLVDGTIKSVVLDGHEIAMANFVGVKKRDPDAPILCYEIAPLCYNLWGCDTLMRNMNNIYLRAYEVLKDGGSLNVGNICGGVAYGGIAGAELNNGNFVPYSTLFSNGVTVTIEGYLYEDHRRFAELFRSYGEIEGDKTIKLSDADKNVMLAPWSVSMVSPLIDNLPEPIVSQSPMTMEQCDFGYGAMLYTTMLPPLKGGEKILIEGMHDNAQLFLGDVHAADLYRSNGDSIATLPASQDSVKLSILVDAMGRVAPIGGYKDRKGIAGDVYLLSNGKRQKVSSWNNYPLPADGVAASSKQYAQLLGSTTPGYYRTTFTKSEKGNICLSLASWGRGEVWINGRSLGRFSSQGCPVIFIPDCWIKDGENELIILDYKGPDEAKLFTKKYI